METAPRPSRAATRIAAWTTRSRLRPGLGPLPGRARTPHAASMRAGSADPLSSSIAHSLSRKPSLRSQAAQVDSLLTTVYTLRSNAYAIRRKKLGSGGGSGSGRGLGGGRGAGGGRGFGGGGGARGRGGGRRGGGGRGADGGGAGPRRRRRRGAW